MYTNSVQQEGQQGTTGSQTKYMIEYLGESSEISVIDTIKMNLYHSIFITPALTTQVCQATFCQ
jgi:hypothetical protein